MTNVKMECQLCSLWMYYLMYLPTSHSTCSHTQGVHCYSVSSSFNIMCTSLPKNRLKFLFRYRTCCQYLDLRTPDTGIHGFYTTYESARMVWNHRMLNGLHQIVKVQWIYLTHLTKYQNITGSVVQIEPQEHLNLNETSFSIKHYLPVENES